MTLVMAVMMIFREQVAAGDPGIIFATVLLILAYPAVFIMRDLIFVRSIGKRIMGLVVLDKQTGQPAKAGKRFVRNLFLSFMQFDAIILLVSGSSIGDRVAHTVVIPKKELDAVEHPTNNDSPIEKINNYQAPAPMSKKKIALLVGCIVGAIALFFAFVFVIVTSSLNAQKSTEEYQMAYEYLIQSHTFKASGSDEDDVKFNSVSSMSGYDQDGEPYKDVEFGFKINHGKTLYVICHFENGEWRVCEECTLFE